ncbi:MAG: phage terminase large subunit family protein [Geminicoccaceae bacterium]|nr:phage terminase large subunit family protein [Geminicoccaceae bacterium]
MIPAEESARPGAYSFDAYPFWRPVIDWLDDDDAEMVVIVKPSQVGWTTLLTAAVGYGIDCDPSRTLVCMSTQGEAEIFSKDRFMPIVNASPALAGKIKPAKSRDAQNTILHKRGPGFAIKMTYATSATALASWPARRAFVDEVDRYSLSVGNEGDPISLIRKRMQTHLRLGGKMLIGSSPGLEGTSLIMQYHAQGTQAEWLSPCHHCGHEQDLLWENVRFETTEKGAILPETAAYACPECGGVWSDLDRMANMRRGRLRETHPGLRIRSIHIKGLHSPHVKVQEIAAKMAAAHGQPAIEQTVWNTDLGLPWRHKGEAPDAERLYERRESYPMGVVPAGGCILTAAVDVQRDRLECEVKAWGAGTESWSVDHIVLQGDPEFDEVWSDLTDILHRPWPGADGGAHRLARLAIDSGFATDRVFAWAEGVRDTRVFVTKGSSSDIRTAVASGKRPDVDLRGKTRKRGVMQWLIGTGYCKSAIYSRLRLPKPEDGERAPRYMHFPQYEREWFDQLASEQLVTKHDSRGHLKREWQQTRPRNEALDLCVLNFAMAHHMGLENKPDEWWNSIVVADHPAPVAEQPAPVPRPSRKPNNWVLGSRHK